VALDKLTFNDHQAAELLHLRTQVAELERTVELLKLDNKQLTEANYALMLRKKSVQG
jgi:hypothetical protein